MINRLDEYYHVASRNLAARKYVAAAHLIHYADRIQELVATSALHREGPSRHVVDHDAVPQLATGLDEILSARKSSRDFHRGSISVHALWKLCFLASGRRDEPSMPGPGHRNTPTSGGFGCVETFPIALHVEGLAPGIFHFDSESHDFVTVEDGDFEGWLADDVFYQQEFALASAVIVLVGKLAHLREKYGIRGYRSALIDVGHASQNVYLGATALGLSVCATTGFIDDEMDEALRLDGISAASLVLLMVGP